MTEATRLAMSNKGLSAADAFQATTDQTRLNPADLERYWVRQGSCEEQHRQQPSRPFREGVKR